jgi:hypothetical protein
MADSGGMEMKHRSPLFALTTLGAIASFALAEVAGIQAAGQSDPSQDFRTSDRCFTCHNNLKTSKGEDVSIGLEWRASIMANSARDPYWQGSVRREVIEHPESSAAIQTDCASCHMPMQRLQDKSQSRETEVLKRLPLSADPQGSAAAADGVSCAVCHQIQAAGLGTPATYSGNFAVAAPGVHPRPVFGPYVADPDRVVRAHVLATGYAPVQADHIRDAGLCGSCHTLYTVALGPDGKQIGQLPEQMPYLEWLHSDYSDKQTCQQCHMPAVGEAVAVSSLMGQPRDGVRRHSFTGANFLMEAMLGAHRDELAVTAQPAELAAAIARATAFLQSQSARVTVGPASQDGGELSFAVRVENLTGHKLPTAFPSRRAWLHVVVTAGDGRIIFESGKLNADGSIAGNANDTDPTRFSPHFTRITTADQVQIFEPILGDSQSHVTTGLLTATQYLKDNRILPAGFDKKTASHDIAVEGEAASDPDFTAGSSTTHYAITIGATGPLRVAAELVYQPVGYRWAHNLGSYQAAEPQRFVHYYEQAAAHSALVLARAETTVNATH